MMTIAATQTSVQSVLGGCFRYLGTSRLQETLMGDVDLVPLGVRLPDRRDGTEEANLPALRVAEPKLAVGVPGMRAAAALLPLRSFRPRAHVDEDGAPVDAERVRTAGGEDFLDGHWSSARISAARLKSRSRAM